MPTYTFRNKETDEEFTLSMKMDEREPYLKQNPHIEQIFTIPRIGDSVRLGVTKPNTDFHKHVIGKIADTVPGNNIKQNSRYEIPREI